MALPTIPQVRNWLNDYQSAKDALTAAQARQVQVDAQANQARVDVANAQAAVANLRAQLEQLLNDPPELQPGGRQAIGVPVV